MEREYTGEGLTTAPGAKRPFERHDQRNHIQPASTMQTLMARLNNLTTNACDQIHGTAQMLEDHADRLHGAQPPHDSKAGMDCDRAEPYYGEGQLGDVMRSLDNLERHLEQAITRLAGAAHRNATLA